jgi:hypothetical protein
MTLMSGPRVLAGEEAGEVSFRGEVILGRGGFGGWAECFPLGLLLFFISFRFSFSCFLFLFLSFVKMLQITSNKVLISSNN